MARKAAGMGGAPVSSLVNRELRRFPWPADPGQRYDVRSPWLAVVNARGPWGVWQHYRIDPQWLPLYRSLLDKAVWRELDDSGRLMMLEIWRRMAAESYWGIVWGDPVRLVMEWGLDPDVFNRTYSAMLEHGFLVYLSQQDKLRVEASAVRKGRRESGGDYRGGERDEGIAGSLSAGAARRQGDRGQRDRGTEGQETGDRDLAPAPGQSARNKSLSGSRGGQGGTGDRPTPDSRQADSSTGDKLANLPNSDHGPGKSSATGGSRRRAPSVPQPLGAYLYWSDPRAVQFGRLMYQVITGGKCPVNLEFAGNEDRSIVGVWAKAWYNEFSKRVKSSDFKAFCERCERDVGKKRGRRGVGNLGAVAMSKIVPGIAAAMGGS